MKTDQTNRLNDHETYRQGRMLYQKGDRFSGVVVPNGNTVVAMVHSVRAERANLQETENSNSGPRPGYGRCADR